MDLLDTNIYIYEMKEIYPELNNMLLHVSREEIPISTVTVVGELEYGISKSK